MVAQNLQVIENMVALTGIEWVTGQFNRVQFSLSPFVSVQAVRPQRPNAPCKSLWCERGVSAPAKLGRPGVPVQADESTRHSRIPLVEAHSHSKFASAAREAQ